MTKQSKPLNLIAMGRRIRTIRDARGLTREQLAEIVDLSPQFIADVEYGNKGLSIKSLYLMSQALRVSAEYLLSGNYYDMEKNDEAAETFGEIAELLRTVAPEDLKGFRDISRIYADTLSKKKGSTMK